MVLMAEKETPNQIQKIIITSKRCINLFTYGMYIDENYDEYISCENAVH